MRPKRVQVNGKGNYSRRVTINTIQRTFLILFRPNKEATEKPSPRNDKIENSQHLWRSSGPNHFFEIFSPSTEVDLQGKSLFSQHLTDDPSPLFKSRRILEPFQNSEQAKTVKEKRIMKSQMNKNEKKRKSSSSPSQDKLDLIKLRTTLRPSYHSLDKLKTIKKARQVSRNKVLNHRARKVYAKKKSTKCDKQNLENCVDSCTVVEDILEYSGCVVHCSEVCKSSQ